MVFDPKSCSLNSNHNLWALEMKECRCHLDPIPSSAEGGRGEKVLSTGKRYGSRGPLYRKRGTARGGRCRGAVLGESLYRGS